MSNKSYEIDCCLDEIDCCLEQLSVTKISQETRQLFESWFKFQKTKLKGLGYNKRIRRKVEKI